MRNTGLILVLTVALIAFAAAPACASWVQRDGARLIIVEHGGGLGGQVNDIELTGTDGAVLVRDKASLLYAFDPCWSLSEHEAICPVETTTWVTTYLGERDDLITARGRVRLNSYLGPGNDIATGSDAMNVYGGEGDDQISGGTVGLNVEGGEGADRITGSEASDHLFGGLGDDELDGRGGDDGFGGWEPDAPPIDGSDRIVGGEGHDVMSYQSRDHAITVTLDGQANDGGVNEGDMVDVDHVVGTYYADTLVGDAGRNTLDGLLGMDEIRGLGGDDNLQGGGNLDLGEAGDLDGGDGNDFLWLRDDARAIGGPGDDRFEIANNLDVDNTAFDGGSGRDQVSFFRETRDITVDLDEEADDGPAGYTLNVMSNVERVTGGRGDDKLIANGDVNELIGGPGTDSLDCGDGADTYRADPEDAVAASCEGPVAPEQQAEDTRQALYSRTGLSLLRYP